jgi:hypothetical protein
MVGGMALHQILNWTTAAGLVLAVVVVAAAYLRVRQECKATLRDHVTAGPAWTAGDSWLTSITGIGGGLLATVAVAHDTEAAWLLGIYALTAALAPILYGALAPGGEQTTGTVAGYLLAALATMFGGIGLVTTMCALGIDMTDAIAPGLVLGIAGLVIVAAICAYGARTILAVLVSQTTTAAGQPLKPGLRPASLLVGTAGRRSATL